MSRRRASRSQRVATPPSPQPVHPAPTLQRQKQSQSVGSPKTIVIKVDPVNREYTPEQWKREMELVERIQALHADPSLAYQDPSKTRDTAEELLRFHHGR